MLYSPQLSLGSFGTGRYGGTNADGGSWLSFATLMTAAGLAVSVLVGSLLTTHAVLAGDLPGTFVRFVLSILAGTYYLYLFHLSQGRRPLARWSSQR